jgi:ABC-type branched-subunit amino acid transport system substrate-binding protein
MSRTTVRAIAVLMALMLGAAACGSDDDDGGGGTDDGGSEPAAEEIDYKAIGLWDDGPCDEAAEPLRVGLMTTFESPVISLGDQAIALEAAAEAFNARGGANGSCIEVTTCDDGANLDQAVACVPTLEEAGVVATINDQGTAGQAEVSAAMAEAGIPRVASNVTNFDWGDPNAYPLDASGTGVTFLLPQALIDAGVDEIGIIRVDSAGAGAMQSLLSGVYEGDATFPYDVPVPAGTTDFTQFILGAQDAGVGGVTLAIGEQEAVQVVNAGQQLDTDLILGSSLGTFPHSSITELGDFADQMAFMGAYPPATADLPVYDALRADLAASGEDALQTENLKSSPMRSWIGLYALLYMMRDTGMTEFTGEGITAMLQEANDVPMLDMFGGESWTPHLDHPGMFKRAGMNHWATYEWDPEAEAPDGIEGGNWVEASTLSFDEVLCGSPFGAPASEC